MKQRKDLCTSLEIPPYIALKIFPVHTIRFITPDLYQKLVIKKVFLCMFEEEPIIFIPYETRNLGVQSFYVSDFFIKNPDKGVLTISIAEKINQFKNLFIQARLAKVDLRVAPVLQRCRFYFVESTVTPQANLIKNIILRKFIYNRREFVPVKYSLEEFKVHYLGSRDDRVIMSKIKEIAENSFSDDRFHIDPNCPDQIADKRFSNWIDDLYRDESVGFYYLEYRDRIIAFLCHKNQDLVLAAFSKPYSNSGLADFFWLSVLEKILEQGILQVKTLISVNNISVLNLYSRLGFKFKNPSVTFHYWSN